MVKNSGNTNRIFLILAFFLVLWTLLPLLWLILSTLKESIELYSSPLFLPKNLDISAFIRAINFRGFPRYFKNSVLLALSSTFFSLIISFVSAYAFARYVFKFRNLLLILIIIPRLIPRASIISPLYEMFVNIGLIDTYLALIIAYTASSIPMAVWILTGFIEKIPVSLEESAAIDGASLGQIMYKIIMPLAYPGIISAGVLTIMMSWNEFPFVLAFTSSQEMRTLPYQLFFMKDSLGIQDWPMVNAFALLTIIPILSIFLLLQRYVIEGITESAVKQ